MSSDRSDDLKELEEKKRRNKEQRRAFIKYWADYISQHDDREWSRQQNKLLNSLMEKSEEVET